jgi:hypothetical protein
MTEKFISKPANDNEPGDSIRSKEKVLSIKAPNINEMNIQDLFEYIWMEKALAAQKEIKEDKEFLIVSIAIYKHIFTIYKHEFEESEVKGNFHKELDKVKRELDTRNSFRKLASLEGFAKAKSSEDFKFVINHPAAEPSGYDTSMTYCQRSSLAASGIVFP